MGTFLLITLGLIFSFTITNQLTVMQKNKDKTSLEKQKFYANKDVELLQELQKARDKYLEIYNFYPVAINDLTTKGMLRSTFTNTEFGNKVSITNGVINFQTTDITMSNLLFVANKKVLEGNSSKVSAESLIKQKDTINQISSNDSEQSKQMSYSTVVTQVNSSLGNLQTKDLSKTTSTNISESSNQINNNMIKVIKGF